MPGMEPTSSILSAADDIQRPMPSIRAGKDRVSRDSSVHVPLDRKLFPEVSHDAEPVAGTRLGHFVIEEQIGRGGMGAVFRAIDQRLNRIVALKVLAPNQSRDPASVQRFLNEARAAARLDHENIARVFFIGEDQGLQFIAFEFVTGTNIREFLHIRGKLSAEEAVNYTLQIALALRHTAAAGVVHRDIKPSNIVVSATGRAKLVDLGLARTQAAAGDGDEITVAGTALGTFDYISPEQARDPRLVDIRSDIYSLGCTLYHMLTGEPPFPQGTMFEKVIEHHGSRPPDPSLKNPSVSPQLARVVQRMMASLPDERYPSPDPLIQDLVAIAQSMGLRASAPESPVWVTPLFDRPSFWDQNRGWLMTFAFLLLIAISIDRIPWEQFNSRNGSSRNDSAVTENTATNATATGQPELSGTASPVEYRVGIVPTDTSANDRIPYEVPLTQVDTFDPGGHPATVSQPTIHQGSITSAATGALGQGISSGSIEAIQGFAANNTRPNSIGSPLPESPATISPMETESPSATVPSTSENRFTVRGPTGARVGVYPTLEAACVEAPDNSVIEVSASGSAPMRESPIRIVQKRLRIQASRGARPVIEFVPVQGAPSTSAWNCIEVIDGALTMAGVDVVVRAPNGSITSLFSLIRSRELTLSEVTLTLVNSAGAPAQFIDIPLPSSAERMEMMAADVLRIDLSHSLIRGRGSFLVNHSESSLDARIHETAFAVSEHFLQIEGSSLARMDQRTDGTECRIELDHCTCLLGHNLLNLDAPMESRMPHVRFDVDDCVVAITSPAEPVIAMSGGKEMDELINLLEWRGFINHIRVAGPWWEIDAPFSTVVAYKTWSQREWQNYWPDADDQPLQASLLPESITGAWSAIPASDFVLRMNDEEDSLLSSDGRTPGVDWSQSTTPKAFPRLP